VPLRVEVFGGTPSLAPRLLSRQRPCLLVHSGRFVWILMAARSFRNARDYSQLNDEQLRSAIASPRNAFAGFQEEHVELTRAYRGEIDAMRKPHRPHAHADDHDRRAALRRTTPPFALRF